MQDTIQNLVKMDREARAKVEQIQKESGEMIQKISQDKEQIYQEYLQRAQHRIQVIRQETEHDKELVCAKVKERFAEASQHLDAIYQENRAHWIDEIFQNCIQ